MMPLNFAILKYFTMHERASADDVIVALTPSYGKMRGLRKSAVVSTLMTAEKNGLLVEDGVTLDTNEELVVYYRTTEESRRVILHYIDE
ncbi:MAG: hypothetical protein U0N74_09445 [Peptococcaceae bacterium]